MRYIYQNVVQDGRGNFVASATVTVTLAGGTTKASIYSALTGGTVDADGIITTGTDGTFTFYVDEANYSHSQQFRIVWSKSGFTSETWDYIQIFPDGDRTAITDSTADQGDSSVVGTIAWHIADAAGSAVAINLLYGTYKIATKLTIAVNNVWIVGRPGPRPVITNSIAGAASDCIEFTTSDPDGAATLGSGCGIEHVTVTASDEDMTDGAAIKIVKHSGFTLRSVVTLKHPYGIDLYGTLNSDFSDFYLYHTGSTTVNSSALLRISGQLNDDASYSIPWTTTFADFHIGCGNTVDYGLLIQHADGLMFSNAYVSGAKEDLIRLAPNQATYTVVNVLLNNIFFDSTAYSDYGMLIDSSTASVGTVEINNCVFGGMDSGGILATGNGLTDLLISNTRFNNIDLAAISYSETSARIIVNGCVFNNCRTDADSGGVITPVNSNTTIISNSIFRNDAGVAAWGIIFTGTHNKAVVTGCTFENFSGGDIGPSAATFNDGYEASGNITDDADGIKNTTHIQIPVGLADEATPTVLYGRYFTTGGTTTITDFDDGKTGQVISVIAEHSLTITDGTNIFLSGSANWAMTATDTLSLICKADNKWYELSRGDNGA